MSGSHLIAPSPRGRAPSLSVRSATPLLNALVTSSSHVSGLSVVTLLQNLARTRPDADIQWLLLPPSDHSEAPRLTEWQIPLLRKIVTDLSDAMIRKFP